VVGCSHTYAREVVSRRVTNVTKPEVGGSALPSVAWDGALEMPSELKDRSFVCEAYGRSNIPCVMNLLHHGKV